MAGTRMPVAEYFNTQLDHYFLAVDSEWGAIDRGEAGPGWQRTGLGFTVRTPVQSPISTNVQRFYGSVSPGPNSHFFTIDLAEYQAVVRDGERTPPNLPRWHSEGRPFNAFAALAESTCTSQQLPVYRAFNGGAARGLDPNHRYSTDKAVINAMLSQGWVPEGVARKMPCLRPSIRRRP